MVAATATRDTPMPRSAHTALALALAATLAASPLSAGADTPPLLPDPVIAALASEVSGELAKRNLEAIARQHRMRGSAQYRRAAEFLAAELRRYGLDDVRIEEIPADGTRFYGTQRSRPAWDAEFAELWEVAPEDGRTRRARLASWDAAPLGLAQDSESADVVADLVDVGTGTAERDYAGLDVRGRIVLAAGMPEAVAPLAVDRFGAAGIVSYAQNQRTAWWGDDDTLVRWGHLGSFRKAPAFGFMVSPGTARGLRERLARGERVALHAVVRAGRRPGTYDVLTATLPGADPRKRDEEIVYSCHLDHPRPGANDNASGCVAILEVARTLAALVADGRLPRPARTLRFVWPPEIEGTMAYLHHRAELVPRMKAVVHLDMVGGGPETKAIFHVTRGPASLPSVVNDVAAALAQFVNAQTAAFAATGAARYPLTAPEGGKEPLRAEPVDFSMGSDHQIYTEGTFRIPAIYMNDWPDRYIHTTGDTPAMIDPTKLKRAAFLAAASGWYLATAERADAALWSVVKAETLHRARTLVERQRGLTREDAAVLARTWAWHEREVASSIGRLMEVPPDLQEEMTRFLADLERVLDVPQAWPEATTDAGRAVYRRTGKVSGPMQGQFGYDYFEEHLGAERVGALALLQHTGLRGGGQEYAYELLNLVDGERPVQQIRDMLSAFYGPVPLEAVVEYLRVIEPLGVVERTR
jgi:aminopeptidase YwaD